MSTSGGIRGLGSFIQSDVATLQFIGNGGDPNGGATESLPLIISQTQVNPSAVINQAVVIYNFNHGTPVGGAGNLEGGSSESYALADGTADMPGVLGFEGVGTTDGNAGRTFANSIGLQGTSTARGAANVTQMVSVQASAPKTAGTYTGTVAKAISLNVQEPVIGTLRQAIFAAGATHLQGGAAANVLEVANASTVLGWSVPSSALTLIGYASDGASVRLTLDHADTPTAGRFNSQLFGSGKHISLSNGGSEVVAVSAVGAITTHVGAGFWNHAAPASQPATPVVLADVIALLQTYGLSA